MKNTDKTLNEQMRITDDEFYIVMPNCGKHDAQEAWEKRVVQILDQQENSPKLSIGYAQTGPNDYISAQQLIQQADSEMYAAKKRKKSE
ncbi:MAG: diguanylate cyclase [Candidatus Thiodiazotropha sp.]|jgi:GGDEF domain-containing protein